MALSRIIIIIIIIIIICLFDIKIYIAREEGEGELPSRCSLFQVLNLNFHVWKFIA